jgi:hypothetical protein
LPETTALDREIEVYCGIVSWVAIELCSLLKVRLLQLGMCERGLSGVLIVCERYEREPMVRSLGMAFLDPAHTL